MAEMIIIGISVLLLVSYFFDITTRFSKVPSVILLLLTGWFLNQISGLFDFIIPNLNSLLPILGTIGLILIVLDGSLELELNRSKKSLINKTIIVALIPVLIIGIGFATYVHYEWGFPFKQSLENIIPFCIISSAIAIPSSINLSASKREFVIYESSLSDILGVIFFNFATFGTAITLSSVMVFTWQFFLMLIISVVASLILAFLLGKIDHHIKYGPIIILTILIYEISKIYHLPALIFILFFGLVLGNIDEMKHLKILKSFRLTKMNREVKHFKDVVVEATFIVRSIFFLVFGFVIQTEDIINPESLVWSVSILFFVYLIRYIMLKLAKMEMSPLLLIAPRGLITILLFLAIAPEQRIPFINQSVIVQVIIISTLIMMIGVLFSNKEIKKVEEQLADEHLKI